MSRLSLDNFHNTSIGHMPWMNLELGSYEQVRLIFDFHGKNSSNIIRACNRILEQRYIDSHHSICTLKKYDDYVSSYCDEEFSNVSAALRSGIFDDANKKFVTECIRRMDSYMAESENFNKSVWRGMSLNKADYMKFKNSGSILFKNFISTSFCPIFSITALLNAGISILMKPHKKLLSMATRIELLL